MENFTNRIIVNAIDRDTRGDTVYNFEFLAKDGIDIEQAVRKAALDFCKTEEGKRVYIGNCHNFNWGDFYTYVNNDFCRPYGFIASSCDIRQIDVNFNEELVSEVDILDEEE